MAVMEVIIQAIDKASDVVGTIAEKSGQAAGAIEANWVAIGAAGAVAGAAFEGAARAQAPLTEQTKKLAASLGMTTEEVRDLAIGMSNVTFPIGDVLALMETGKQLGLESAEALEKYATNWDMIGDATGLSGPLLAEAGVALKILGISAGEEEKALAAFGFITENTTSDVSEFLQIIGKVGPEMADMGLSVDDAAALLGVLEQEMGLTGRVARQELQAAIKDADGDMGKMLETLGVSTDVFDQYKDKVAESSDIIERNAQIHEESYTTMQKLQHSASEMMFKYGDLIGVMGNLAPLMMGLGPIIKGLSLAKAGLAAITSGSLIPAIAAAATSVWTFTAALLANPITWIIIGIIALIAAIYLLWKNWDEVSEWLTKSWEWVKEKAVEIWGAILGFFTGIWDSIKGIFSVNLEETKNKASQTWEGIKSNTEEKWNSIKDFFGNVWENIRGIGDGKAGELLDNITDRFERIFEFITEVWNEVVAFFTEIWEAIKALFRGDLDAVEAHLKGAYGRIFEFIQDIWGRIKKFFLGIWDDMKAGVLAKAQEIYDNARGKFEDLWNYIKGIPGQALQWGKDILNKLWDGMKSIFGNIQSWFQNNVVGLLNKLNPWSRSSPSLIDNIRSGAQEIEKIYKAISLPEFGFENPGPGNFADWPGPGGAAAAAGPRTINVTLEIDGETLLRAIGEPLVEEIRLKTGVRI